MSGQLVDRVAGLQVGEPEAGQDVRAADDEDREVDEIEEEVELGREGRDQQDRGDDEQLESADHRAHRDGRRRRSSFVRVQALAAPCSAGAGAGLTDRGPFGPPVGRMPSIGRRSSSSRTTLPDWTSWIEELVLMIRRWASAGSARALMSSGMT